MDAARKTARERLKQATKSEFEKLIADANLTPSQEKIARLHFSKDWTICKIALTLACCDSAVRKHLSIIYDKIAKM